jgi:hypothetical protein
MAVSIHGTSGLTFNDSTTMTSGVSVTKAWVRFADNSGTISINATYNVSSVTRNGTGDYSVNFSTAMTDANACANITSGNWGAVWGLVHIHTISASLVRFISTDPGANPSNQPIACVSVFR